MWTTCEYGLRSRKGGCGYALRSKGAPSPLPKIQKSPRPLFQHKGTSLNPNPNPNPNFGISRPHMQHRLLKSEPKFTLLRDLDADPFPPGDEDMERLSRRFANVSLSYLREQGHNYELVKPDLYEAKTASGGARFHCNFKAKRAADPCARMETFFAQLLYARGACGPVLTDLKVECCVSLGESDSLPKERDSRGCNYCSIYVHHPVDGCEGIEWGR